MPQDIVLLTALIMLAINSAGLGISLWVAGSESATSTGQPLTNRATLFQRLPLIGFNLATLLLLSLGSLHFLQGIFDWGTPAWLLAGAQLLWVSLVDDTVFYFYHRWLHLNRAVYRMIHRIHHKAHAPVPIEYIYVHPFEWMGGSAGPFLGFASLYVLTGHLNAWVFLAYTAYRTIHELSIHGGRRSRIGERIWWYGTPRHHGFHHSRPHDGNYAATYIFWDRFLNTEVGGESSSPSPLPTEPQSG